MRAIDADKLFEEVGKIKPRNKEHYESIGEFMNMITNSETIDVRMAIDALEQESCEDKRTGTHACDCISRQAAIDVLDTGLWGVEWDKALATVMLKDLPSAEKKSGKWILDEEVSKKHIEPIYICSACKNYEAWGNTEKTPFCPNCGARMESEGE